MRDRRFRDPAVQMLTDWIASHCRNGADPTEVVRAVIDTVKVGVGSEMLRGLLRTRAYHSRSGELAADELLTAGAVVRLVREATGLAAEPGQPIERQTRRSGLSRRLDR